MLRSKGVLERPRTVVAGVLGFVRRVLLEWQGGERYSATTQSRAREHSPIRKGAPWSKVLMIARTIAPPEPTQGPRHELSLR